MTRCKLCNSPQRGDIEKRIVARELTQVDAAAIIHATPSAISRHMRNCFPRKVAEFVKADAAKADTLNVIDALTKSHETTLRILQDSLDKGDRKTALLALQTEMKQLELMARLNGQLNKSPQIGLQLSPEYVELKAILNDTLAPFPELRQKLGDAFSKIANGGVNGE
jgi:predicted transcriptional regulator